MPDRLTIKNFLNSEFADELFVVKLEDQVAECFHNLSTIDGRLGQSDYFWQELQDNINLIEACLTILGWYSNEEYLEERLKVNKYKLRFKELY